MRRADAVSGVATFVVAAAGHRTSFEARVLAEYPARPAVLTLKSTTLPQPLVDACHKRCTELARKLSVGEKLNAAEMQSPGASRDERTSRASTREALPGPRDTFQLKQIADLRAEGSKTARQDLVVRTLRQRARPTGEAKHRRRRLRSGRRASLLAAVEYLVEFATSSPARNVVSAAKRLRRKLPTRALAVAGSITCLKRRFSTAI